MVIADIQSPVADSRLLLSLDLLHVAHEAGESASVGPDLVCAATKFMGLGLASELEVPVEAFRSELAGLDRCAHRAPRFGFVTAVPEPAIRRKSREVGVGGVHRVGIEPQPELADSRGVDQTSSRRELHKLATGCGVATLVVALSHRGGLEPVFAKEEVYERRFAGPRGSQKHRRRA